MYHKLIFKSIISIMLGILILSTSCYKDDGNATVTINFKGNNLAANSQQKPIIDRILGFFSKPAYAAWNSPCNRLTLTISGRNIDEQFFDTGYKSNGIAEHTFTASVPSGNNVIFEVLSYNSDETINWGGRKIVSLAPGRQNIDITMIPMTKIIDLLQWVDSTSDSSVTVTFDKITSGSREYKIYRSTEENSNYKEIGFHKDNSSNSDLTISYKDTANLDINKNYYYKVSVISNSGVEGLLCTASLPITITSDPPEIEGMVWIKGGTFMMGQVGVLTPVHEVTLTKGFYMGKYEVTQEQYLAVIGTNPSLNLSNPASGEIQERRPVERVSWYDALVFCNKLSVAEGLTPAYSINGNTDPAAWGNVPTSSNVTWNAVEIVPGSTGYRLPTGAQWEYACRASTTTIWFHGDAESGLEDYAWYLVNSGNISHEVGKKLPNAWGLYDMHGNVWEWCWDWSGAYSAEAQTDPVGVPSGSLRVTCSGSRGFSAMSLRSSHRGASTPSDRNNDLGFRVVRP